MTWTCIQLSTPPLTHMSRVILGMVGYHRKDGTKATTQIRRISGDVPTMTQEMCAALKLSPDVIRVRNGRTVEVDGHHVREIKHWLASLGF